MARLPSWTVVGWGSRRGAFVGAGVATAVLALGAGAFALGSGGGGGDRAEGQLAPSSTIADPARTWVDPVFPDDVETTTTTEAVPVSTTGAAVATTTTAPRVRATSTTTTTAPATTTTSTTRPSRPETVGDYTVACTPTTQTIVAGKSGSVSCTYTSVDGFSGTVQINCLGASVSCAFDRASVDLVAGGSAAATAVVAIPAGWSGTVDLTLSAYSRRLSHPTRVRIEVSTFRLRCSPSSTYASPGGWTDFVSCELTSQNGWSGTATLSCSDFPPGITCVISPESVSVPSGGTASTSLRAHVETDVPPNRYAGSVVGRSDTVVQKGIFDVTVTSPSSSG